MFTRITEYIQTNKKGLLGYEITLLGYEITDYLDELKNSKVFKHSNINIIDNLSPQSFQVKTLKIDEEFRFFGDIYLYSINLAVLPGNPFGMSNNTWPTSYSDSLMIRGVFENQFTTDPQRVKEIDRLDKLDQLDI